MKITKWEDDLSCSWEQRFNVLKHHHVVETAALSHQRDLALLDLATLQSATQAVAADSYSVEADLLAQDAQIQRLGDMVLELETRLDLAEQEVTSLTQAIVEKDLLIQSQRRCLDEHDLQMAALTLELRDMAVLPSGEIFIEDPWTESAQAIVPTQDEIMKFYHAVSQTAGVIFWPGHLLEDMDPALLEELLKGYHAMYLPRCNDDLPFFYLTRHYKPVLQGWKEGRLEPIIEESAVVRTFVLDIRGKVLDETDQNLTTMHGLRPVMPFRHRDTMI